MTSIQPCALLLLVGLDWRVETISANVAMLGDHRPSSVVGQPLANLIGSKAIHSLRNRMSWLSSEESEVQDFGVEWGAVTLDIRATHDCEHYLIEAELSVEQRLPDAIGIVRSMADRLERKEPVEMANQAMRQLSALTGFDQLALIDRNGQLIAAAERGKRSLAALPRVGAARVVADRDSEAVPLVGIATDRLIERAAYLTPAGDECEALAGQGVTSTMAMPLRIDGEQVASLHAQHPTPRRCGLERRGVAHLFAERLVARMTRFGWQP